MIEEQILTLLGDGRLLKKAAIVEQTGESEKAVNGALRTLRAQDKVRKVGVAYMSKEFKRPDEGSIAEKVRMYQESGDLFTAQDLADKAGVTRKVAEQAVTQLVANGMIIHQDNKLKAVDVDIPGMTGSEKDILRIIQAGAVLTSSEVARESGYSDHVVHLGLGRLSKMGYVRKVGKKYKSTGKIAPPRLDAEQRKSERTLRERNDQLLHYLRLPRTIPEIVEFTDMTRQGVNVRLKALMEHRMIHKGSIQLDGSWKVAYCTNVAPLGAATAPNSNHATDGLTRMAQKVLAAMPTSDFVVRGDLADHLERSVQSVNSAIRELMDEGLIMSVKGIGFELFSLTRMGRLREEAQSSKKRMKGSDLIFVFGRIRADIMRILAVMGEMPAQKIRLALSGLHRKPGMGSVQSDLKRLVSLGFISERNSKYRIEMIGQVVVSAIDQAHVPFTQAYVNRAISAAEGKTPMVLPRGSALDTLHMLSSEGSIKAEDILKRPDNPFTSQREVDAVMSVFEAQGMVSRKEEGWTLSDKGEELLSDQV